MITIEHIACTFSVVVNETENSRYSYEFATRIGNDRSVCVYLVDK